MRVADRLVITLREFGVRYFFSVSGANIEAVHDAIYLHGDGQLTSILAKHESAAAFMADCYARVHRTLGVCGATSGGGMCNLLAGIAEANAESVPLLALVGQPPTNLWGKGAFQDSSGIGRALDAVKLFSQITKFTAIANRPDQVPGLLCEAVYQSLEGRPGASVLLLPRDILLAEAPGSWPMPSDPRMNPQDVQSDVLLELQTMLATASHPLVILGQGALRSLYHDKIVSAIRQYSLPVVTTVSAKGAFPNSDPLFVGCLGVSGSRRAVEAIEKADTIVLAGAGWNVMTRSPVEGRMDNKRFIYVNVEADYIDQVATPALKVIADAGLVFSRLLDHPFEKKNDNSNWARSNQQVHNVFPETVYADQEGDAGLSMYNIVNEVRSLLPRGAHIVADAGNAGATACHLLDCPDRGTFTTALGMGGMGYAIAGAVGAALPHIGTEPEITIVVTGDGSMLMNGSEINTMVHYKLPILMLVLNNGSHGMCLTRQQLYFEARFEAAEYPEIDCQLVASGLAGDKNLIEVRQIASPHEMRDVFARFLRERRTTVIEALVRKEELPPFLPFQLAAKALAAKS
jgi:acetolactate synthase-1/2/3 large subunit